MQNSKGVDGMLRIFGKRTSCSGNGFIDVRGYTRHGMDYVLCLMRCIRMCHGFDQLFACLDDRIVGIDNRNFPSLANFIVVFHFFP